MVHAALVVPLLSVLCGWLRDVYHVDRLTFSVTSSCHHLAHISSAVPTFGSRGPAQQLFHRRHTKAAQQCFGVR